MSASNDNNVLTLSESESFTKDDKEMAHGGDEVSSDKSKVPVENSHESEDFKSTSESCYKYDENGIMIYTDPSTKTEYVLDPSGSNWIARSESESKYDFDGKTYLYTDEKTGIKHRWDLEKNSWVKVSEDELKESHER